MEQRGKYRYHFEAENKESPLLETDNPTEVIRKFIEFDNDEVGRHISLPNVWDRMIIEKKQKSTYLSSEERES